MPLILGQLQKKLKIPLDYERLKLIVSLVVEEMIVVDVAVVVSNMNEKM